MIEVERILFVSLILIEGAYPILFRQLFDPETSNYTYLIADTNFQIAVLVDPVLEQIERDLNLIHELGLVLTSASFERCLSALRIYVNARGSDEILG